MSTSGGFNPPSDTPCYDPRMTRAEALARRTAGTLDPNCVVVITDGPVIGTAGNTSPTEIELNPVSATELGSTARVHTTFDNTAWTGTYDIDEGPSGTILRLTDNWNNIAQDDNPGAPTIHTQVPWHKGGTDFRGNSFHDAVLIAWDIAGGSISDNVLIGATVNLTGKTAGTFNGNQVRGGFINALTATSFIANNQMTSAVVDHQGTGAGSFSFQNNTLLTGVVEVDAATTSQVTMNNNVFGGAAGGYRVAVLGKTSDVCIVTGNRMFNNGFGTYDLTCSGPATIAVTSNELNAGDVVLDGAGDSVITGSTLGSVTLAKDAGSTSELHVEGSTITNADITISVTNDGEDNLFDRCIIRGGTYLLDGPLAAPARNDFLRCTILDLDVAVAATATGGVSIDGGLYNRGSVIQTRTAGTAPLTLTACGTLGAGSSVTNSGAAIPGAPVELSRVILTESTVNMAGVTSGSVTDVSLTASQLDVSGTSVVIAGRMLDSDLTTAGFDISTFDIVGAVHTLTADQSDRVRNALGSNLI